MRASRIQEAPSLCEIRRGWGGDLNQSLVTVRCATFNHLDTIEAAVIGALRQKTSFPFKVVIHDDASTDGTTEILREYESRFPGVIDLVVQPVNLYSQGFRPGVELTSKLTGRYIAVCEGDDAWSDPGKLEKQVQFLEEHPEYVISGHDVMMVDASGDVMQQSMVPETHRRIHDANELICGDAWIVNVSRVYRNLVYTEPPEMRMVLGKDLFRLSLLGGFGRAFYHSDITPAIYRSSGNGIWSSLNDGERLLERMNTAFWLFRYYHRCGEVQWAQCWWRRYTELYQRNLSYVERLWALEHLPSRTESASAGNSTKRSLDFFVRPLEWRSLRRLLHLRRER